MSELHLSDKESKGFPQRGDTDYLSPAETAFVQRIFGQPVTFPQSFWSAVLQKVALDGEPIPRSQVQGLSQFVANVSDPVAAAEATASTTYTDLATVGPQIEGLSDGFYLVLLGCRMSVTTGGALAGLMSVQVNDDAASDAFAIVSNSTTQTGSYATFQILELRNSGNNTLTAKYRVTGVTSATYAGRTMIALKTGS